ncbi:intermembrane phospholipid transport protein YdbH family protein [Erythrobacter alti]|uniref:intermembrane phospholipid transport protein YdbH family protein n=1 Tax=Erythrobacter alti TaxID=1896145 RepID=UPI0030F48FB0
MAQIAENEGATIPRGRKRRWLRNATRIFVGVLLLALVIAWLQRREIADTLIADTFADNNIRATYTVDDISPTRQVITDLVIGDPERPDLTVERLVIGITPRLGLPDLTSIVVVRPRIYGSYRDGTLSFGDLDPLLFGEDDGEPFEFPDAVLVIEDGRGLIETDFGRVGLKLAGGGHMRGGFRAELAAVAQELTLPQCTLDTPTLYGAISIDAERPRFVGPVRFASLACPNQDLSLADATLQIDTEVERNLVDLEGSYSVTTGRGTLADMRMGGLSGDGRFTWRDGNLNALYDVAASRVSTPFASTAELALEGRLRTAEQFARIEVEGDVAGSNLVLGEDIQAQLASAAAASQGTLAAPLLDKFRSNLTRALRGSTLAASFDARMLGELSSVTVPEARLRGGDGATLLALSRARFAFGGEGLPRFSGNLASGGAGLPQITGRMEQGSNGALELRLAMREYAAGNARLAVPQLSILQGRGGRLALEGRVLASGPLPGGFAQGLVVPIDGTIDANGTLALWSGCRNIAFDRLELSNLRLGRQSLTLCPPSGRSILRYGSDGLRLAAGATSLNLAGEFAETPLRLRSGPIGFAYPGSLVARDLDVSLGPADGAQRFTITDLRADLSAENIGGDFAGADVFLASVPLDVLGASGDWRYQDDRLVLNDASFVLEDREQADRFEPLMAEGASLMLFDNLITAEAALRHPGTGRLVSDVTITHDLSTSSGSADLDIAGLTFEPGFQPLDLSRLALGVVANVRGTVTGQGRITWDEDGVRSSGEFSSDSLDLAAAFGPVRGASGTVVFTDLLGLTTAPDQRIRVASINPGIEVNDGEVGFQLVDGELLGVTGGSWPFMGGTLTLRSVDINIGVAESRTYILDIEGLQAARFIERMELNNLAASGTFDGTIPIVFDADGNGRLVGGFLNSRPPGGHISYVGDLTYEDMSFFANYAFAALRDLRYDAMEIDMDGPLTGELVTRVRFTGIGQGETAESNIVTRAVAQIPIDLRINIRAPFYQLITSLRAMYDPAALRDPRDLGLLTRDGARLRERVNQETVDAMDDAAAEEAERELLESLNASEPDIQPPESEPEL